MREHYDGWQKASHHAVATCNDCHTPHAAVPKYLAKLENGFRHSKAFTLNDFHEPIRIKPHNRKVLNHNCATCHAELVRAISAPHGMRVEALDCARCHAGVGHAPPR
jgi:cytochrome c nitrite reductase small subunit